MRRLQCVDHVVPGKASWTYCAVTGLATEATDSIMMLKHIVTIFKFIAGWRQWSCFSISWNVQQQIVHILLMTPCHAPGHDNRWSRVISPFLITLNVSKSLSSCYNTFQFLSSHNIVQLRTPLSAISFDFCNKLFSFWFLFDFCNKLRLILTI